MPSLPIDGKGEFIEELLAAEREDRVSHDVRRVLSRHERAEDKELFPQVCGFRLVMEKVFVYGVMHD